MKKFIIYSFVTSSLVFGMNKLKADWDFWGISANYSEGIKLYTVNSKTEESTLRTTKCFLQDSGGCDQTFEPLNIDPGTNKVFIRTSGGGYKYHSYDLNTNTWEEDIDDWDTWKDDFMKLVEIPTIQRKDTGEVVIEVAGSKLLKESNGTIQIGADGNDIDITAEGLNIDGNPLITKKDNGEIHIGKNSLITKSEEETLSDGTKVQPLYAKDADGNKIPINIDGSKLLIDGVEVTAGADSAQVTTNKNNISTNTSNISINTSNISTNTSNISTNTSNIKNLGSGVAGSTALTAALSSLPQTSKESKLSCGVGTGAYSSRYAVGFGCASKLNERFDVNAGGSYVFGGSKSYGGGTLDSGVVKAGFVFKLGELNKPIQISMKDKKVMETKIGTLIDKNEKLQNKVSTLMARLERLEKIASRDIKSKDLALIKN